MRDHCFSFLTRLSQQGMEQELSTTYLCQNGVKSEAMDEQIPPETEQKPEIEDDIETVEMETASPEEEAADKSGVIKITNISPGANLEQMKILFGFLGNIVELALYPTDENVPVNSKICYVKYEDKASCDVSQHLTNTVFVDRPLVIVPVLDGIIPDEGTALQPKTQQANGIDGNGEMEDPFSSDPFSQFMGNISIGNNLPPPPVLGNIDPVKIEEIRRTIYVGNLDDIVGPEMLVAFFSGVGEIKYVRQSQNEEGQKFALIEFTDLSAVATALQYAGVIFCGKPLHVTYSKCTIIKPDLEKLEAERKNADRHSRYSSRRRSSSLSRRRSKSRSASKSKDRKKSRRSRTRSRSGSRSRSRRRRSRSSSYSRNRRRRSRSRSYSRTQRRRSRSLSRSRRRRRSRTRSKSRSKEGISKKIPLPASRDRRRRRSYSRSRSRDSKYRSSSSRHNTSIKSKRRSKSRSPPRSGSVEKKKSKSRSPSKEKEKSKKEKSRSRSRSPYKSHSRRKSRRDRRSRTRSRSRSRDRKTRDKDRERDRKRDRKDPSEERLNHKEKKEPSPKKEATPQYKDVDDIADNSDMSLEEDEYETKKKSKSKSRYSIGSDEDSSRKSKKRSRSKRDDSD